jgi:chorismate dehydratase
VTPRLRLGAVEYLNARPLVHGLERSPRFALRFDVPSRCAELLHAGEIDVGLIPSIEYLRGPRSYGIVPYVCVASRGPVASVALYTRKYPKDLRSIAMDTTSRTSVALVRVVARQAYGIDPEPVPMAPDLDRMLARADGAVIIGDKALFLDHEAAGVRKIDLGELWTETTGLPFVYAFWAGRPHVVTPDDVGMLREARNVGLADLEGIARTCFPGNVERQAIACRYLRDNIQYTLGDEEFEGLTAFYRYASELGLVSYDGELRTYHGIAD